MTFIHRDKLSPGNHCMNKIEFLWHAPKCYTVKLNGIDIGWMLEDTDGLWKINPGIVDDQKLHSKLETLSKNHWLYQLEAEQTIKNWLQWYEVKEKRNSKPCESGASLFGKTMKYTYRFKNPDIETALNVLCGKDYVQKAIREQYDNSNEPVNFKFPSLPSESVKWGHISVSKSEIERVRAYDPDDWNPFPEVNPPECGEYLVTFKDEDADYVQQNYFDMLGRWETAHSDVIAFRALPTPYQQETGK